MAKSSARLADNGTPRGTQTSWDRARLSIVVPISVIVAVAIVCIVVAVLTSARRADEVALDHEKRLFSRALVNHGERILRELESVTATEEALRRIRDQFDREWVHNRIGLWLKNYFDHDFVFVADGSDRLTYSLLGRNSVDPGWFNSIVPELMPTLDYMRGRSGAEPSRALRISEPRRANEANASNRTVLVQRFLGRPAAVAARLIASGEQIADPALRAAAPIVVAVKFIDEDVLADIAARVQLEDLHIADQTAQSSEYVYEMKDKAGHSVMRLAWMPKKPGAEIVKSVIPFIAVAFAGFALLAALIHGYMRRT
ncbi:MAG: CHASE4 domain-containing protein, partial [Pseudorhodoplanes sp.]